MSKERTTADALFRFTFVIIVGVAMLSLAQRMSSPDFGKTTRMRIYLGAKRFAQSQADHNYEIASEWQSLALRASTQYNRVRM